jgi:hypothetical protein
MGLTTGLVSYWRMNEIGGRRSDHVGGNHLADNNTVGSAIGPFGRNAVFASAGSDFLDVADNVALSTSAFTLAGWVKLTNLPTGAGGFYTVASKWSTAGNQRSWELVADVDTNHWLFRTSLTGAAISTTVEKEVELVAGAWAFLVASSAPDPGIGPDLIRLSVNDGDPAVANPTGIFDSTSPVRFGQRAGTNFLNGELWGWGLWNRDLTPAERLYLYNGGAGQRHFPFGFSPLRPCMPRSC